jgi:CRP-like cAMP-binding protein
VSRSPLLDKRSLLERVSLFAPLAQAELSRLAEITATKRLRARQVLFRKGDAGTHAYVIISGRLKVAAVGEDGKETVLRIMDPGEVIGEIALLDSQPRSGTVTALEPAELLVIQRRDLIPFLEQHPKTAIKLLRALAERLRSISVQLEDRVFLKLPPRLAKKLLALSRNYGQPTAGGVRIDLRLKQGELGEMVGTSRESINKQLRSWTRQGLVKSEKGYITILEPQKLERLAGLDLG